MIRAKLKGKKRIKFVNKKIAQVLNDMADAFLYIYLAPSSSF